MNRKPFDQALFDKNDEKGRKAVKELYKALGYKVADHPDPFWIDLLIKQNGTITAVEVDHKAGWKEDIFPFKSVIVNERKRKFLEAGCLHAVVNNPCSTILVARSQMILLSPLTENKNKYVAQGELVYNVPIDKWTEYRKGRDY
jgi:hypothetical protein